MLQRDSSPSYFLLSIICDRTLAICDATLEKAGLKPADIDQVLLVGGQTRLPAVKAAVRDRYGWTINDSVNCMFKVDHDGILHVLAEDVSTEGEPVEKTFDRI